ncbi:MAG: putative bifunctional diguanylate cyclase/phosphodiesterase [Pseudonocardiaceae bacterium]
MDVPAEPASREDLARAWWAALRATCYMPLPAGQAANLIAGLLDRLVEALTQDTFAPHPAAEVGARLVKDGFVGARSLGVTLELLAQTLPTQAELQPVAGLSGKVASLLGELASGYATALRRRTLDQQEEVKSALVRSIRMGEAKFREVFDAAPLGIAISRLDGPITDTNITLGEILGQTPASLTDCDIRELFHPEDAGLLAAIYQNLANGQRSRFRARVKLLDANGDTTWASLAVSLLRDAEGTPTHHVTMVEDVTDVHLLEERLRHQTLHDLLTGLPNQEYFWIHLQTVLERARPGTTITLCKIDLDGFAVINDGHGHEAGNLVLRAVATRLKQLVEDQPAMVARFGADEFVIVIEESANPPDLVALAKAINSELSEPVYHGDYGLAVSAGIGLARRPAHGSEAAELVRIADTTLHRAKRIGRAQWGLDDPHADAGERAQYTLAMAMPGAWENGQVTLRYQPLVRLDPVAADCKRIVAVQALLHWEHPARGVLAPEECVALGEQTGLVISIGPWMLQQACAALRAWRDLLGTGTPPLRVDLTAHLAHDPDLMAVLRDALNSTRLRPEDLQLGIPIGPIFAGCHDTEDNLRALADAGVGIVLTRYGQTIGNLAMLENRPVQAVDITDPSVRVSALQPDSIVREALGALVPLIRRTGTAVVVGNVDSAEEADWWRSIGLDSARGAAFAASCEPEHIPALLTAQ